MCGIVGLFDIKTLANRYPEQIVRMLAAIAHRGPDEYGYFFDRRSALGTARLSIIDLQNGQQPVEASEGRYWLAMNGEIFNYIELRETLLKRGFQFSTSSDTEVMLKALMAWDTGALPRLNGQFAFIFLDRLKNRVLVGRDPYGERPLFYSRLGNGYAFASEIKALMVLEGLERRINPTALRHLYSFWSTLPEESCFEGIFAIPPGHWGELHNGTLSVEQYYRPPLHASHSNLISDLQSASISLKERLHDSIALRLRSDVPVATYLSGGLDSSIITALASEQLNGKLSSFSISFDHAEHDESKYQNLVSRRIGTEHHVVKVTLSDIASNLRSALWHTESPIFRSAPVPMYLLAREMRKAGYKVALTGEGADEIFLGYDLFKETLFRIELRQPGDGQKQLEKLSKLYSYLPHFNEKNARVLFNFFSQTTAETVPGLFSHEVRFKNSLTACQLLSGTANNASSPSKALAREISILYPGYAEYSAIEKAQALEFTTLLSGYLLSSQGDRMTAAHGVEGRCPFLDPSIAAFGLNLSPDLRLHDGVNEKFILKSAFADYLPPEIISRPKQPYRAPDAVAYLRGSQRQDVLDLLSSNSLAQCGYLDSKNAESFVKRISATPDGAISPRDDHAFMLLLSTVMINQLFIDDFHAPNIDIGAKIVKSVDGRAIPNG